MSWVRIDDAAPDHPKLVGLDDDAFALWVRALCYCARHGTDGRVPGAALPKLTGRRPVVVANKLVAAGLWICAGADFEIHDFLAYNPSAEQVRAKRDVRAAAGRTGGIRSGEARSKTEAIASPIVQANVNPGARDPGPIPSRPDPVPKIPEPSIARERADDTGLPAGPAIELPTLLAVAADLAAEEHARGVRGLGTTVCEQQPRPPTDGQKRALRRVRDERAALASQPARAGPAIERSTLQQPAKPGEHDWSTGPRAPSEF